ncbi:NucA/NucB deoxyribonuclease domain-containing protein [Actinoplanes sp. NPDC024001]|uniref:NucA/NucB deoxyribonuclease domain-containing protein n=1 Tax=Actinoplanes sp. NPDC024001 TaxID=3154598 RepID=UPI0033FC1625
MRQLPGHPGRPGDTPFTRVAGGSSAAIANRDRSCDKNPAFRYDGSGTECDEYPFATTSQTTTSPFSAMPVPAAANNRQGNILSDGILKNRINVDDLYYVVVKTSSTRSGSPAKNSTLNTQFTSYGDNAGCADWSGGDATNSVQIPGTSKRAWFFSDSYLGAPSDRRNLFATSPIRNSIVVQDGSTMRTITGGNTCQELNQDLDFFKRYAKTPAADPDGGFFWTGDQVASGGDVVKFYYHGRPNDIAWVNDYAAVATLSGSALSAASTSAAPTMTITPSKLSCAAGGPDAMWGTMVMRWSDGNYYIYGTGASVPHKLYLARASAANLTNFSGWQFFGGSDLRTATGSGTATWTTCARAKPLPIGEGATGGSIDYINGTIWLIQDDYVNPNSFSVGTISAHPSQTPWGFTDRRIPLYDPPEGTHTYPTTTGCTSRGSRTG